MVNLYFFEIDLATFFVICSVLILLLQLLLCFNAKKTFIKLLPVALLTVSTIVFSILSACSEGWDGIGYLFFALFSFGLLFICGICWGVWAIVHHRNR